MKPAIYSFVKRGLVSFRMKNDIWSTVRLLLTDGSVLACSLVTKTNNLLYTLYRGI
ncbi:MAG TPA: hypothetical protein PLE33_00395 [Candidatus Cloacimonas sp.]|nr:hypothetical protein [Candidatus Cloacimonas sp.]